MIIHHHYISSRELAIDVGLAIGTIAAIFTFGLAAIPWFPVI